MFSPKQKKVHYERGTKGGKSSHGHRSSGSRDSGVGSSSASDRASLGTPEIDTSFSKLEIEKQRHRPNALNEALDAANERIRQLEAANTKLNIQLTDSNKENRTLKKERMELLGRIDYLKDDLEEEKKKSQKLKRESSLRISTTAPSSKPSSKPERRSTPPRKEPKERDSHRHADEKSQRRVSWREIPASLYDSRPPTAPQPPQNTAPNPFLPNTRSPTISVAYAPTAMYATSPTVAYTPAPLTYNTSPAYPPRSPSDQYPNDGRYHHYPL